MRMLRLVSCAVLVIACSSSRPKLVAAPDRTVLTRDEIAGAAAAPSMYDVIRRLRPEYLTDRGRTSLLNQGDPRPVVFMDEQEYGPIESLRNVQPAAIKQVRFYGASAAVARFGSRYGAGIIQLQSVTR